MSYNMSKCLCTLKRIVLSIHFCKFFQESVYAIKNFTHVKIEISSENLVQKSSVVPVVTENDVA